MHEGVCEVGSETTDKDDGVQADTKTRAIALSTGSSGDFIGSGRLWRRVAIHSLQGADLEAFQDFSCFVRVADVFEGFGGILATNIE